MRPYLNARFLPVILACGLALPADAQEAGLQETGAQETATDAGVTLPPEAPAEAALPAGPTLSPEAADFKAALQSELAALEPGDRAAIDGFFAGRLYQPFWTEYGARRQPELVAAVSGAAAQALPEDRYDPEGLDELFRSSAAPASLEVAASRAFLAYGHDVSGGIVRPAAVSPEYIDRTPDRPEPTALMARLEAEPVAEILRSLEPKDAAYGRLLAEKARLEDLVRGGGWGAEVDEAGPALRLGDEGLRVAELRGRLERLGYLDPAPEAPDADAPATEAVEPEGTAVGQAEVEAPVVAGAVFDDRLLAAVERFQRDSGLNDDGVVGALTLRAVNASPETRLAQVAVNLERMRWMPDEMAGRYLWVNIPDFSVQLFENGAPVWESRVVVGKAVETETPEFDELVRTVVVNPTWHIPDSIAIRDYLPRLQRDPMVLKNQGIDLLTRGGTVINPKLVNFTQYTPENFPFRIKQRPSDDNALGHVKFLFPNHFAVYMHDTPHREYFANDMRAYSNGCIRVQKPIELAEILLAGQEPDPRGAYDAWRGAGKEKAVTLETLTPVHIVYNTVFFDEGGDVRFRHDVYGRDATLFRMMREAGVTLPAAQG